MRVEAIIPILQVRKLWSGDRIVTCPSHIPGDSDPDLPEPRARSLNLYTVLPASHYFCNWDITSIQYTNFYRSPPPRSRDWTFPWPQSPLGLPPWIGALLTLYCIFYHTSGELEGAWADTKSSLRPHTPSRNLYRNAMADLFVTAIDVFDCVKTTKNIPSIWCLNTWTSTYKKKGI